MATQTFFDAFFEAEAEGVHNFASHTIKALFSNAAPSASADALRSDLTSELGTAGGYTSGGVTLDSVTSTRSGAVYTLDAADEVFTATGDVGPFRYVVFYNDTATDDPLISYVDYGSSITLADTETFTISFAAGGIATKTSA